MTALDLAELLNARRNGAGWMARCPAHQDRTPSLSISEGEGGRVLVKCMAGCPTENVLQAAGLTFADLNPSEPFSARTMPRAYTPPPKPAGVVLPADLHAGNMAEVKALAQLRGLNVEAVILAAHRGLLSFGTVCGYPCWLVLDQSRNVVQARRVDGKPFPAFEGGPERKAHTLRGSCQGWPLGVPEAASFGAVALVEGGPDLLAAFHFAWCEDCELDIAPVAMLGASQSIPAEALPMFAGKRVRIFAHADDAGMPAAQRWEAQLLAAGVAVDVFNLAGLRTVSGAPVKDLNDLAKIDADDFENDRAVWRLFDYAGGLSCQL